MKNFICMKWGTLYGSEYVNHLYEMCRYFTTGEIRFVCLTDSTIGLHKEIECYPCPEISIRAPYNNRGWRKVTLFGKPKSLYKLEGNWLYLDLDVVLTDNIDCFFDYEPEKKFIVMKNWTQPKKKIGNTSCYRFKIGADTYLLDNLLATPDMHIEKYRISQKYISDNIHDLNFWPDEWCTLFKVQCVPKWPFRYWITPKKPFNCKVIAFPGQPNPHEAISGNWPVKKSYKRLYKYIKPTRWIKDIWDIAERSYKND